MDVSELKPIDGMVIAMLHDMHDQGVEEATAYQIAKAIGETGLYEKERRSAVGSFISSLFDRPGRIKPQFPGSGEMYLSLRRLEVGDRVAYRFQNEEEASGGVVRHTLYRATDWVEHS